MASTGKLSIWRLVRPEFAPGLDGWGAARYGGRWNSPGLPVVYCSIHLSLAVLEYFVHIPPQLRRRDVLPAMTAINLHLDDFSIDDLGEQTLPHLENLSWCRARGDEWLQGGETAVLAVPSVIVQQEKNFLLNPGHPDFERVRVVSTTPFNYDSRMAG